MRKEERNAWETIKNNYLFHNSLIGNEVDIVDAAFKRYATIEQTLIKRGFNSLGDFIKQLDEYVQMSEKEHEKLMTLESQTSQNKLDAFEIIKETRVDTNLIKLSKDYDDYCSMEAIKVLDCAQMTKQRGITEEEYYIVKRALK